MSIDHIYNRGDFVFATCIGFKPYPATITKICQVDGIDHYYIKFSNYKSTSTLLYASLEPFNNDTVEKYMKMYQSSTDKQERSIIRSIKLTIPLFENHLKKELKNSLSQSKESKNIIDESLKNKSHASPKKCQEIQIETINVADYQQENGKKASSNKDKEPRKNIKNDEPNLSIKNSKNKMQTPSKASQQSTEASNQPISTKKNRFYRLYRKNQIVQSPNPKAEQQINQVKEKVIQKFIQNQAPQPLKQCTSNKHADDKHQGAQLSQQSFESYKAQNKQVNYFKRYDITDLDCSFDEFQLQENQYHKYVKSAQTRKMMIERQPLAIHIKRLSQYLDTLLLHIKGSKKRSKQKCLLSMKKKQMLAAVLQLKHITINQLMSNRIILKMLEFVEHYENCQRSQLKITCRVEYMKIRSKMNILSYEFKQKWRDLPMQPSQFEEHSRGFGRYESRVIK